MILNDNVPFGVVIDSFIISSSDKLYFYVTGLYESGNSDATTDGSDTIPSQFIYVNGQFPGFDFRISHKANHQLTFYYKTLSTQTGRNREEISVKYHVERLQWVIFKEIAY